MHLLDIISTGLTAVGIHLELTRIRRERRRAAEEAAAAEAAQPGEPAAAESGTRNGVRADADGADGAPEADGA